MRLRARGDPLFIGLLVWCVLYIVYSISLCSESTLLTHRLNIGARGVCPAVAAAAASDLFAFLSVCVYVKEISYFSLWKDDKTGGGIYIYKRRRRNVRASLSARSIAAAVAAEGLFSIGRPIICVTCPLWLARLRAHVFCYKGSLSPQPHAN